jgi:hypothetical protein
MDNVMKCPVLAVITAVAILTLTGGIAQAQIASTTTPSDGGRPFVVVGGGSTTLLGDCTDCPADTYTHSGGIFAGAGTSLTTRTAVGFEVFWMPSEAATGEQVRTTYLMGTFVFQPWQSKGFFFKASTGMALVRNWVVNADTEDVFTSKAFALGLGAGWEWPLARRLSAQVIGSQHVATLGDLTTSQATIVENVVGNFWSVGGAIVIR